ncbi:hypothetical protein SLE2022_212310 [Rubroshorea leprosula]
MAVEGLGSCKWRFISFYGRPKRCNRRCSWSLLQNLVGQESLLWLVCGDFSDLLSQGEKIGGNLQLDWMIQGFNETIAACGLTEVQMVGGNFTWKRGKVLEKLYRGLASAPWKCLLPQGRVRLLPPLSSDHTPFWLTIDGRREKQNRCRKKFRFEEMWLRDVGCQEVIQTSWHSIGGIGD